MYIYLTLNKKHFIAVCAVLFKQHLSLQLQNSKSVHSQFYWATEAQAKFFVQLVELIIHLKAIDYSGCAVSILIIPFGG